MLLRNAPSIGEMQGDITVMMAMTMITVFIIIINTVHHHFIITINYRILPIRNEFTRCNLCRRFLREYSNTSRSKTWASARRFG